MGAEDREAFLERTFQEYLEEVARLREVPLDRARPLVERERRQILPEGPATPDHHFWWLVDPATDRRVGELWVALRRIDARAEAWIYDLRIEPAFRRRGYAEAALRRLEGRARELGAQSVGLNVFAWNRPARALYDKVGFRPVATQMTMRHDGGPGAEPAPE